MTRTVRVATLAVAAARPTLALPVVFDEGAAIVSGSAPRVLAGHALPRSFSAEWCRRHGLKGEPGSSVVLRGVGGGAVVLVTVGSTLSDLDHFRLVGAVAARVASDGSLAILLPTDALEDAGSVAQALVEGALLASYRFRAQEAGDLEIVPLGDPLPSVEVHDAIAEGARRGAVVAEATNWAKRLIDTPAGDLSPKRLARTALHRLDEDAHVSVDVWTRSRLVEEGLGGVLGVARGSDEPPRLVYATYDPAPGEDLAHVALVGKGVTFDSGGLSLKPAEGMMSMKTDMTGAAVVLGALSAASRLQLQVRVTAIAPLVENLPGPSATKPGDVLRTRNGKTIEVLNTDAEGRLILADGLSLAVEANPDAIIDVATLTGAQRVALGEEIGALFATTDELATMLLEAGERAGEPLWRMPLTPRYAAQLDSEVAEMRNIGKGGAGGMIVAALMLEQFTDGRPWAHLDIAAPARAEAPKGYVTKGGTAFSLRTLVEFLGAAAHASAG